MRQGERHELSENRSTLQPLLHKAASLFDVLSALRSTDTFQRLKPSDALLICHDGDRGETLDGRAYSKFIDSIADELAERGWTTTSFALPYSHLVNEKGWGNPASANRKFIINALRQRLTHPPLSQELTFINEYKQGFYLQLLRQVSPRVVICIGASPELCAAARDLDIKVVEVLHGYGYAKVPWGWEKYDPTHLPHAVLSFDGVSTQTFSRLPGVKVFQTRNPWYAKFTSTAGRQTHNPFTGSKVDWLDGNAKTILVSLAWGYDGDHGAYTEYANILPNGLLPDTLWSLIQDPRHSINWLVRLHPLQLRLPRYKKHRQAVLELVQKNPRVNLHESSTFALPALLKNCDGHITMSSQTTYDAAFMGVKTLLLCPTLHPSATNADAFEDLKKLGYANFGSWETGSLLSWINDVQRAETPLANTELVPWSEVVTWMLGSHNEN